MAERKPNLAATFFGVILLLSLGCSVRPIARHTAAFATATTLVVNGSTTAYEAVNNLHEREQASAGVMKLERGEAWDPRTSTPLITAKGMQTRIKVLVGLKAYAQGLSDVTNGVNSTALDSAGKSVGAGLKDLGAEYETATGTTGLPLGTQTGNGVSAAAKGLGQMLIDRKIKRELPGIVKKMDPNIETLCRLLEDDIATLTEVSTRDYDDLIRQQLVFVETTREKLSPGELRMEAEKIPVLVHQKQSTLLLLSDLNTAITRLSLTHHALEAALQGNNPEALTARITDLVAAGQNLATYYKSLPTS